MRNNYYKARGAPLKKKNFVIFFYVREDFYFQ